MLQNFCLQPVSSVGSEQILEIAQAAILAASRDFWQMPRFLNAAVNFCDCPRISDYTHHLVYTLMLRLLLDVSICFCPTPEPLLVVHSTSLLLYLHLHCPSISSVVFLGFSNNCLPLTRDVIGCVVVSSRCVVWRMRTRQCRGNVGGRTAPGRHWRRRLITLTQSLTQSLMMMMMSLLRVRTVTSPVTWRQTSPALYTAFMPGTMHSTQLHCGDLLPSICCCEFSPYTFAINRTKWTLVYTPVAGLRW